MSGHLSPQKDSGYVGKLGLLSRLPGGCSVHPQPPRSSSSRRRQTDSPAVPRGQRLEWHLKSAAELRRGLAGRAGGRGWLRRQLDPNPSSEGRGVHPPPSHCAKRWLRASHPTSTKITPRHKLFLGCLGHFACVTRETKGYLVL